MGRGISRDGLRRRLRREGGLSLGKHGACPSVGKHVNDDLGEPTFTPDGEGPQAIVAGQRGRHAATVRAEVHIGDIRAEIAPYLPECGFQLVVEHDGQGSSFYPSLVFDDAWPIEHEAAKIVMRPSPRHHRFCRRRPDQPGWFLLLGRLSVVCLLTVARSDCGTEHNDHKRAKDTPELCLSGIQNI